MTGFAACVVLYNPPPSVAQNIRTYAPFFDCLYVADNTPGGYDCSDLLACLNKDKIIILRFPSNPGIAKALKTVCTMARNDGHRFLLTMDQDSWFPDNADFDALKLRIDCPNADDFGQFAIPYWPSTKNREETWYWSCSSGSVINLKNYGLINGFDEGLVVDLADFDLGFQFYSIGKPTLVLNGFRFNHQVGYGTKSATIFGKTYSCRVYSPFRYYYFIRNDYILRRRYPQWFKSLTGKDEIIAAIFCLKPRTSYMKAIICAFIDAKRGKLGKYKPHSRFDKRLARSRDRGS